MKKYDRLTKLATPRSAAQNTLIAAMCEWWMATDRDDALRQINAAPGKDLAGITNSVIAGLESLAESINMDSAVLIEELALAVLVEAKPEHVVLALDAIHEQWIRDNFNARRWAEKFFKGQLYQYRKTANLPWSEVKKDLLFISSYLARGGWCMGESDSVTRYANVNAIYDAFERYANANAGDDDLAFIAEKARTFAPEIVGQLYMFRVKTQKAADEKVANGKDATKELALLARIDSLIVEHDGNGESIMEAMIASVS